MNVLSIAGSDPSSGAGIQSDIKTFSSLGAYGLTVLTSITSQNTTKFDKTEPVSSKMVKNQIDSIFSDFKISAIKIGMVYNSSIIRVISSRLSGLNIPIVIDPVIKSTTGGMLLEKKAFADLKKFLIPLAYVITPNVFEAEKLTGIRIKTKKDLNKCATSIQKMGPKNVIITGYQLQKNKIADFVLEDSKFYFISGNKLSPANHGSGCTFSSSLTFSIAQGKNLKDAVKFAKNYTYKSIKNAKKIGKGIPITRISEKSDENKKILYNAINNLVNLKNFYSIIPEVQTNFVYSKSHPKSTKDILGISGRIVKAGNDVIVAGNLEYGGSKHVGNALLEMSKKFPSINSAINLKYDQKLISKFKKKGFIVQSYNRVEEPINIKNKENSSISWGIKNAIKNSKRAPDIVYHTGDLGKEPMILIFGKNPKDVIKKVSSIL